MIRALALAALLVGSFACSSEPNPPPDGSGGSSGAGGTGGDDGFEPFFDGESLNGLTLVGVSEQDLKIEDGTLRCDGQPHGYIYKNGEYENFVFDVSFRFERPSSLGPGQDASFSGNGGYLVYVQSPHEVWPTALEVQGGYGNTGDIFGLPNLASGNDAYDEVAFAAARRSVGEWNDLRVTSRGGALEVILNERVVNRSTPGPLSKGFIALQSEGAAMHWKAARIKRLP